jgi:hypothetical protein
MFLTLPLWFYMQRCSLTVLRHCLTLQTHPQGGTMKQVLYALLAIAVLVLAACDRTAAPSLESEPTSKIQELPVYTNLASPSELSAQGEPGYNITLQIVGDPSPELAGALQTAVSRWEGVVTGDLPGVSGTIEANSCGGNPGFSGAIDDVLMFAGVADIDGSGGILAQAGPCFIRSASGLTIAGTLIFDSADVDGFSGQLAAIAVHEMGHILGIGTLWDIFGLLRGGGTDNPTFLGRQARLEYRALGGRGRVPVENTGGAGTRDGHWRESVFDNELMTGFLNDGFNPLSRLTIASLADLGYSVALGAADDYALPLGGLQAASSKVEFKTELLKPVARVE